MIQFRTRISYIVLYSNIVLKRDDLVISIIGFNCLRMSYRYLKNVFPKADETILLDILEQSDNNVQKASEKLIELGYEKRSPMGPAKSSYRKKPDEQVSFCRYHKQRIKRIYHSYCFIYRLAQNNRRQHLLRG